jgi:formyl-CoA transferase
MGAAPLAVTFLGDFGADVIKVEHPIIGDHIRSYGMTKGDIPLYLKTISHNKRAITLDFQQNESQKILKDLIKSANVVIENFRPAL